MYLKHSIPNCNGHGRDKVALATTRIKNVKFNIIKIRTGCQYVGYFYYRNNLNCAAQNLHLGCGLDIAGLGNFFWCHTAEFQCCWCARRRGRTYCTAYSFVHLRCTMIGKFKYGIRFLPIFSDLYR